MKKKLSALLLATFCFLSAQAQTDLPFWKTAVNSVGLYGAYDERGACTIPPLFQEMSFWGTNEAVYVRHNGLYYLIDRSGRSIGEGKWTQQPLLTSRYAVVGDGKSEHLLSLEGQAITPPMRHIEPLKGSGGMLLCMETADGSRRLTDVAQNIYVDDAEQIAPLNHPKALKITRNSLVGVCNYEGETIVPCQYADISEFTLSQYSPIVDELLKKGRISKLYTAAELSRVTLLMALRENGRLDVTDEAGTVIATDIERLPIDQLLKRMSSKGLMPYLQNKAANDQLLLSHITLPAERTLAQAEQSAEILPRHAAGTTSLIDRVQAEKTEVQKQLQAAHEADLARIKGKKSVTAPNQKLAAKKATATTPTKTTAQSSTRRPRTNAIVVESKPGENPKKPVETATNQKTPTTQPQPEKARQPLRPLPNKFEYYYASADGLSAIVVNGSRNGGEYTLSASFNGGLSVFVAFGKPRETGEFWSMTDDTSRQTLLIKADMSSVQVKTGSVLTTYSTRISEPQYQTIKQRESELMKGGGKAKR